MAVTHSRSLQARFEALVYEAYFRGMRALPMDKASAFGGWLLRGLGPLTPVQKVARINLHLVFPDITPEREREILSGMWDNFGRTLGEFPHLDKIKIYDPDGPVEVINREGLDRAMAEGKGAIFVGGHFANLEILAASISQGVKARMTYRQANNYWIDKRIVEQRRAYGSTVQSAKGREGGIGLMRALKEGYGVAIMNDQKYNEGVAAPFFGTTVMTADGPARLARRFKCPLVPVAIKRTEGVGFRITVHDPIPHVEADSEEAAVAQTVALINKHIETWILDAPEQWFWVHRRWPKEIYKADDPMKAALDYFRDKTDDAANAETA